MMERAPDNSEELPPGTEVSRAEKEQMARPERDQEQRRIERPDRSLSRNQLINKLNHINFQNGTITAVFKHHKYPRTLNFEVSPQPCVNEQLVCAWTTDVDIELLNEAYRFHRLFIIKGQQLIEVAPTLKGLGKDNVSFILPVVCREISERKHYRFQCRDIDAFIFQNSALFYGRLVDYGALQLGVQVGATPPQTFAWLNDTDTVTLVLTKFNKTLYSGQCRIVKQDKGLYQRHLILEPTNREVQRFSPQEFRSTRQVLSPSPDAFFTHPLPGLIIPGIELIFSDGLAITCMAQVVYSKGPEDDIAPGMIKCGLAILDMNVEDHKKLLALLHQANDDNAYICNRVDMEALWDFFFETGFIYPKKYEFIQTKKEDIKATYEKLYQGNPRISAHFIYQKNGRILAHMAMLRFYERSWLIHHHAALRSSVNRGGLVVLNQVGRFINDSHRLDSMKLDYVFCYYRPDNKFPNHVFGGAARNIQNLKVCSVDPFAYLHCSYSPDQASDLPAHWCLEPATPNDLSALQTSYEDESGGLMMQALHLTSDAAEDNELSQCYQAIGLKRKRHLFALRQRDKLCAILVVNLTDFGLNLSDLTNSVHFITAQEKPLTMDLVATAINKVLHLFEQSEIPVLIYPRRTADNLGIDYEKTYNLWIFNTQNLDPYFRFLKRIIKFIQH
ncbi:MAG: hypothetical protein P8X55_06315 [Desulfosarcinaceae bacterium]